MPKHAKPSDIDSNKLACPICSATFLNIFPAGKCIECNLMVCGHCIHHDLPEHSGSICQSCLVKMTPYGQLNEKPFDELLTILSDPFSNDSAMVARLLGDKNDPCVVPDLCRALGSERIDVRRETAEALGKLSDNGAVPYLQKALNDPAPAVRGRAAAALADLGATQAIPALKNQVDDPSRQAAGHALHALGKLLTNDTIELFNDLIMNHPSNFIRCEALKLLAGVNHEKALKAALFCLEDTSKKVLISACKILGKLKDLEAVPTLKKLIEENPPASVRMTAQATLNKIIEASASA